MVDPHSDTQYTCQILDGGDEPIVSIPITWVYELTVVRYHNSYHRALSLSLFTYLFVDTVVVSIGSGR